MAVTHGVYGPFVENLLKGNIANLAATGTEITLALMSTSHTFNQNQEWWSDVSSNTSTSADYSAQVLTGKSVAYGTSTRQTVFDAADVNFGSTVSIKARAAVLYYSGTTSTNKPLMTNIDFGATEESVDGTFELQWNASGIFTATVASV